jgi:putative intracellular protease/amidase
VGSVIHAFQKKRVAIIASNPSVSKQTGWRIGFWRGELTHPHWEFTECGYDREIFSPDGGNLEGDGSSDPRDQSGYSSEDLLRLGFLLSPTHRRLTENSRPIRDLGLEQFDAVLLVGGHGPMYTFYGDERLHSLGAKFFAAGKITAVICHAISILLNTKLSNGKLLGEGKAWTGLAKSEEGYADSCVGRKIQPFWMEEEARKVPNANFIVSSRFRPHAVGDGNLVTAQQQYSGAAAARLVIQALGR